MSSEVEILRELVFSHYKLRIMIGVEPRISNTEINIFNQLNNLFENSEYSLMLIVDFWIK